MLNLPFKNFPELTTERLILRELAPADSAEIHKLRSNPDVNKYLDRTPSNNIKEAEAFIDKIAETVKNNQGIYWVITMKGDNKLIGTICFWNFDMENNIVEMGYELLPEFQGKGIMTEAIKRVIDFGFQDMGAKAIAAVPSVDNIRSIVLLEKSNFKIDNAERGNNEEVGNNMVTYTLKKEGYSRKT